MNENTLQAAANKGRTKWLRNFLKEFLPQLDQSSTEYQDWFDYFLEFMCDRGLTSATQQKDYLSDVRNAIRALDPQHPALEVVDFSKETWIDINNQNSDRIAQRTTKLITDPDAIVQQAKVLLKSYQWSEIAAGLAVVTGRRCTEVIKTAQFKYKSKYSIIFTGSLKRREEPIECVFEIPTLCEAELVIEAITSLRTQLGTEIHNLSKRQVSRLYGKGVTTKCDLYFHELVPLREDKDNLYTHLFRAVYATIASFWYCPPTVPEIEYRAAIQGHYQILDEKNPNLRRSIATVRNYFDYRIADEQGNIDGRLGIKLAMADVEIIEQFKSHQNTSSESVVSQKQKDQLVDLNQTIEENKSNQLKPVNQPIPTHSKAKIMNQQSTSSNTSSVTIPSFFLPRLKAISAKLEISEAETIQALFTWTEMGLSLADSLDLDLITPQAIFESVEELKQLALQSSSSLKNTSDSSMLFDRENINQICTSVRLLAEAVSTQQKNNSNDQAEANGIRTLDKLHPTDSNNKAPVCSSKNHTTQADTQNSQGSSSSSRKVSNRGEEAEESVNSAIDAIMDFNNQEDRQTEDKWHIGIGSLRKLSQRGDSVINRVVKKRKEEIERHHSLHGLGKWHNARGKDYPSISEVILLPD